VIVHTFHGHVFHSYFGNIKTLLYKRIERFLAKKSDAIIAISEIQKKELAEIHKIAKASKFRIIPLGFDLDRFQIDKAGRRSAFRKKYNIADNTLSIGIVGRLTAIKNHELLFDSIEKILKRTPLDLKLFIIGDGELMNPLKV
jgi:glycosyltransferase involved in cell wall biosynthesis